MQAYSYILLKTLLNAYYGNHANTVCRFLPSEEAEQVKAIDTQNTDFSFAFRSAEEWLQKMHYSWIAPAITAYPVGLRPTLAAALPPPQDACIRQLLSLNKQPAPLNLGKQFLQKLIYDKLKLNQVVPEELLPASPFKFLVKWTKDQLCHLIDLLSMYDLADKLKQVVDRKRLRDIYACLSRGHLEYLRYCMHLKGKVISSELNLEAWKGDPKELTHLLHRRGLLRLGRALSKEPKETLWYILHRLDTGRSGILLKCIEHPEAPSVVLALSQQVQAVVEYLDNKATRE